MPSQRHRRGGDAAAARSWTRWRTCASRRCTGASGTSPSSWSELKELLGPAARAQGEEDPPGVGGAVDACRMLTRARTLMTPGAPRAPDGAVRPGRGGVLHAARAGGGGQGAGAHQPEPGGGRGAGEGRAHRRARPPREGRAPHAEVVALEAAGAKARGADLYTTLEPCDHYGRTPPCSAGDPRGGGAARVICASSDPNPLVNGKGVSRLRRARSGGRRRACCARRRTR